MEIEFSTPLDVDRILIRSGNDWKPWDLLSTNSSLDIIGQDGQSQELGTFHSDGHLELKVPINWRPIHKIVINVRGPPGKWTVIREVDIKWNNKAE